MLHGISLEVPQGQVTTLLGPNGAGKSTMVLAVGGVLRTDRRRGLGRRDEADEAAAGAIRQAGVAIVPEGRRLLSDLTVEENMRVATYALGRDEAKRGIEYAIELFPHLETRWKAVARTLSGGEQQMVVLAQALVSRPKFVLVDELSLGLAPVVVQRLIPALEEAASHGVGVLLIEQFVHVALGLGERAYVIEGGRIVYEGTAAELKEHPEQLHSAYLLRERRMPPSCSRMSTDELEIRRLVENWVIWRDAGDWERFRTVWHDDGRMMATWFQGPAEDFIRVSREGFERGVRILHFLGGFSVDVAGARAVSQTKMTITQRADVEDVECDVVCTGRFVDFLEKRDRWGIVLRQPIYESDRIIPVDPASPPTARPRAARVVSGGLPASRIPADA